MATRKAKSAAPQLVRTVRWVPCVQELPDDALTVLMHAPNWDEPVLAGFYDSESATWREVDTSRVCGVTHWANMPEAP